LCGLDANEVSLVVELEEYNGQTQAKVKWVNRSGAAGVAMNARMGDDQRRAFAARMKGAAVASRQQQAASGNGAKASAAAKPAQKPTTQRPPQQRRPQPSPDADDPGPQDPGFDDLPF
jgi:hypothetical protein